MEITHRLEGYQKVIDTLAEIGGPRARRANRQALARGLTKIKRGIAKRVPRGSRRRGRRKLRTARRSLGTRVFAGKTPNTLQGKVGVGVGMKKGTYAPHAVFIFGGTSDRWTGEKTTRGRVLGVKTKFKKATGKARRYRGRVQPGTFVDDGFRASQAEATQVMEQVAERVLLGAMIPSPESDFDFTD